MFSHRLIHFSSIRTLRSFANSIEKSELAKTTGSHKLVPKSAALNNSSYKNNAESLALKKPFRNAFRPPIYSSGELDATDWSLPPSPSNPYPFDSSNLPPTYTRCLASVVNGNRTLCNLVDMGMDLFTAETEHRVASMLALLDWNRDVVPRLQFLMALGLDVTDLGDYLSENPHILSQDVDDLHARVDYLKTKNFAKKDICKIVVRSIYWLNTNVKIIDKRLGWVQRQFEMDGDQMRALMVKEPRLIDRGTGILQRICLTMHHEFGFSLEEMKKMLIADPRLFMTNRSELIRTHSYLMFTLGFSNRRLCLSPFSLRISESAIRRRHLFLKKLKLDQYDPDQPRYVSLELLLHPSDSHFCTEAARCPVSLYNHFQKTL